jgi:hypothetical protein
VSEDATGAVVALLGLATFVAIVFVIARRQKRARLGRGAARQAFATRRKWEFETGPRMWPLEGLKQLKTFAWLHNADANNLASPPTGRVVLFDLEWVTPSGASYRTDRELVLRIDGDWRQPFVAESGLPFHDRHPNTTVEVHGRILALTSKENPPDLDTWVDDALALASTLDQNSSS